MATGYGHAPVLHVFVQQDLCTCSTFVSFSMLTAHWTAWSHVTANLSKDLMSMRVVKAGEAPHRQALKLCMCALQTIRNALPSGR